MESINNQYPYIKYGRGETEVKDTLQEIIDAIDEWEKDNFD